MHVPASERPASGVALIFVPIAKGEECLGTVVAEQGGVTADESFGPIRVEALEDLTGGRVHPLLVGGCRSLPQIVNDRVATTRDIAAQPDELGIGREQLLECPVVLVVYGYR